MPENGGSVGKKRTKTSILCSKCPKIGVLEGKSAQKPRFCARNALKRGFRRAKAHKNPDFVLEMIGIGIGKRGNWHREEQPWPSCKSPRTLLKYKYLITRQLTFASVLGDLLELHPRPSSSHIQHQTPVSRPGGSLITYRIPAPRPCNSLIRRRYVGGVGNRCRWAERFAMSEQRLKTAVTGMGTYI